MCCSNASPFHGAHSVGIREHLVFSCCMWDKWKLGVELTTSAGTSEKGCQVYSEVLCPFKEALRSHLVPGILGSEWSGSRWGPCFHSRVDTTRGATYVSEYFYYAYIYTFKKRWKPSLLQKLPLFAFLATFPSQLWSWNKFFPPPAPPSPFLLKAMPALETETTNDTSALCVDRRGCGLLGAAPTASGTSSVESHPGPHQGSGLSPQVGLIRILLTEFPWQLPWSLREPRWGFASHFTCTGAQPVTKGQWLPHQLHHPQSPGLTRSFFCFGVNIM